MSDMKFCIEAVDENNIPVTIHCENQERFNEFMKKEPPNDLKLILGTFNGSRKDIFWFNDAVSKQNWIYKNLTFIERH